MKGWREFQAERRVCTVMEVEIKEYLPSKYFSITGIQGMWRGAIAAETREVDGQIITGFERYIQESGPGPQAKKEPLKELRKG